MPRKKPWPPEPVEETEVKPGYVTASVASQIISRNSGHRVDANYMTQISRTAIRRDPATKRLNLYNLEDVKAYRVGRQGQKNKEFAEERKRLHATQAAEE